VRCMDARGAASGKGFWRLDVIVAAARLKAGTTLTDGGSRVQRNASAGDALIRMPRFCLDGCFQGLLELDRALPRGFGDGDGHGLFAEATREDDAMIGVEVG